MSARQSSELTYDTIASGEPTQKPVAPPDTANEIFTRRAILTAFWVVVVLLGLPHWLWTTSVYRAELDVSAASQWIDGKACSFHYPIYLAVISDEEPSAQGAFTQELLALLRPKDSNSLYEYREAGTRATSADFTIRLQSSTGGSATAVVRDWGSDVIAQCTLASQEDVRACASATANTIQRSTVDEQAAIAYLLRNSAYGHNIKHDLGDVSALERRSIRAFRYASSYHITFSLFAASSTPSAWDIERALQAYINPLLDSLSSISNFTVDTQVQLFSSFSSSMAGPHFDEKSQAWLLSPSDLSGFINAAEWPLSPSIDSGPTINLVLYVPAADKTPLQIADSSTHSWIIPQWGGVQILNHASALDMKELEPIMYTFADQLTALVGLPQQPASLQLRIKALTRERIAALIVSASETLGALIRLTQKLEQIAIPHSVAQAVSSSVADLEQACQKLEEGYFQEALEHARLADEVVEKAFFEPSMVGQVYFPDEHKVAVYVPLLGPMAVPLIMATIKEIREFRQRKIKTS